MRIHGSLVSAFLALLAIPSAAFADFSLSEGPQAFQDMLPMWVFQILSGILTALLDVLFSGAFAIS